MEKMINKREDKADDILKAYIDRNRFWTQQALNQFGFTSNFFFLLSISFFAFLIKENKLKDLLYIDFNSNFSVTKIVYLITLIFGFISIVYGALTVLSRLNDLRLTRHITEIRKKCYKKWGKQIPVNGKENDEGNPKVRNKYNILWESFINSDQLMISKKDFKNIEKISEKISDLRCKTKVLSEFSWLAIKIQIGTLVISLLFFFIATII